jgi:hypothetical protein
MKEHFEQVLKDREFDWDVFSHQRNVIMCQSKFEIINNAKALYNKYERDIITIYHHYMY